MMHSIQAVAEQSIQPPAFTDDRWSDDDDAHRYLDSPEFRELVEDQEFCADLSWACKRIFNRFRQSTHPSWEDLQQEVLIRFGPWLPLYRKEANRKTVFAKIATNLLIDARRAEAARRRQHNEIDLEDLKSEPLHGEPRREMEYRIFLNECREMLSQQERDLFDEHFIDGESLRQLAKKHGVSAAALSKQRARIKQAIRSLAVGPQL